MEVRIIHKLLDLFIKVSLLPLVQLFKLILGGVPIFDGRIWYLYRNNAPQDQVELIALLPVVNYVIVLLYLLELHDVRKLAYFRLFQVVLLKKGDFLDQLEQFVFLLLTSVLQSLLQKLLGYFAPVRIVEEVYLHHLGKRRLQMVE